MSSRPSTLWTPPPRLQHGAGGSHQLLSLSPACLLRPSPPARPRPGPALLLCAPKLWTVPKPGTRGVRGAHAFGEAGLCRVALGTECSGGRILLGEPRREAGRSRGGGQAECKRLSSTFPSPRSPQWWRPSEGLAAAGLAPLSVRRGARAARGAEPREAEGAEAVSTLSRVCSGSSRGGRGRLFPPTLREQTRRRPSVPRGFLQTSARVSGGRGPLLRSAGGLFRAPFRSSPPWAGGCLFLETLSLRRPGSPGSRSNSRPPSLCALSQARRPGSPAPGPPAPAPGRLVFAARLRSAGRARAGSWGWARARSEVGVFCAAPRPDRRGEEGRERRLRRGGLGRAGAWLWPGLGPRVSSGFPVGPALWGSLRRAKLVLSFPSRVCLSAFLASYPCLASARCLVGRGRERPALELGAASPYLAPARASVFTWVKWGQEGTQPLRV